VNRVNTTMSVTRDTVAAVHVCPKALKVPLAVQHKIH
jgi:hypothetical protein